MRCTCCNNTLKSSEIIWYPDEKRHEDLCGKCLARVRSDCYEAGWEVETMFQAHDELEEVVNEE